METCAGPEDKSPVFPQLGWHSLNAKCPSPSVPQLQQRGNGGWGCSDSLFQSVAGVGWGNRRSMAGPSWLHPKAPPFEFLRHKLNERSKDPIDKLFWIARL